MSSQYLLDTYHLYRTSWVRQDWAAFRRALHHSYDFSIGGRPIGDVFRTVAWSERLLDAFPDYQQVINAEYPSGDVLVVEAVASGTSNGRAPAEHLPAPTAGKRFQLPYVKVLRFEDGLIREDRQYHDTASFASQLYDGATDEAADSVTTGSGGTSPSPLARPPRSGARGARP